MEIGEVQVLPKMHGDAGSSPVMANHFGILKLRLIACGTLFITVVCVCFILDIRHLVDKTMAVKYLAH